MEYRRLGNSGLWVSRLILGCMSCTAAVPLSGLTMTLMSARDTDGSRWVVTLD